MTRSVRIESRVSTRAVAGLLTAVLHVGVLALIVLSGGRRDGIDDDDTPVTRVVFFDSQVADRRRGSAWVSWSPATPPREHGDLPDLTDIEPPSLLPTEFDAPQDDAEELPRVEVAAADDTALTRIVEPLPAFVMPQAQASSLVERVERVARELALFGEEHTS